MSNAPLTAAEQKELLDLLYEENWYIKKRWGDLSQADNAQRVNEKMLSIVTRGAYPVTIFDTEETDLIPEVPQIGIDSAFKAPSWAISGSFFPVVLASFTPSEFRAYVQWVRKNESYSWSPTGITMHHTAWPNLDAPDNWENGWTAQLLKNARSGYINDVGFTHGPHIFSDHNKIWVFNPLSIRGTHASSFNYNRYGIEMLLDGEDKDQVNSEKGKKSIVMGQTAAAILMKDGGISTGKLNFHRHDPKTSKTCPGSLINFEEFESAVIRIHDQLV